MLKLASDKVKDFKKLNKNLNTMIIMHLTDNKIKKAQIIAII